MKIQELLEKRFLYDYEYEIDGDLYYAVRVAVIAEEEGKYKIAYNIFEDSDEAEAAEIDLNNCLESEDEVSVSEFESMTEDELLSRIWEFVCDDEAISYTDEELTEWEMTGEYQNAWML